ncbi:MAG: sporulation integral membrane protein YtvI [Clostridia bacterium]|nr:sporulation integral membrane protein YtvI [Clostridia bacterium]
MEKYKKIINIGAGVLIFLILGYIFLKYLLGIILPFLIALLIVAMVRPTINKIAKRSRVPKAVISIFVLSLALITIILALTVIISEGVRQLGNISQSIIDNLSREENVVTMIFEFISKTEKRFPFLANILGDGESVYSLVMEMVSDGVKNLSVKLTTGVANFITSLPQIAITAIVILLSIFYFAKDYDKIGNGVMSFLPSKVGVYIPIIKRDVLSVISKYIKSYLILLLITFACLFSGFLFMGIENAFIIALIVAFIDFLPILGAGSVLIPWAIILLINKNVPLAIGLLVLTLVIYIVRQYAEPRILSAQMNVHPLITLLAMYAGFKIAGIGGMVVAPILAFIIKTSYISIKNQKNVENEKEL